ncbi:hypothetical protein CFBP7900_22560 [Xanthomonas hortorum pv. carotae]|uniref:Secreted protein n=1 Tax=Xanthomonas hortorum pv. carotae TaxID=487904 RepID=A0A6V7DL92_9XANT|nr:hypothetical protein CFBP7900_22560 [Xanthomonas hortorum pv. carotae]CAD0336526.1 hypothetical protein CFBP7900_22560 [Xanthomonas hortorum pv. carotae]
MKTLNLAAVLAVSLYGPAAVAGDFATSLRSVYPSLSYVERYRDAFRKMSWDLPRLGRTIR